MKATLHDAMRDDPNARTIEGAAEHLLAHLADGEPLDVRDVLFLRDPLTAAALVAEVLRVLHDADERAEAGALTDRLKRWAGGAL